MSEDLSDVLNNFKTMMDNGNINVPDNLKEMLGNLNTNSNNNTSNTNYARQNTQIHQAQLNQQVRQTSPNQSSSSDNNSFNIDIETILKMKTIIDSVNKKDDPRANLLYSLKPYLRESRKKQLDQYVNLLNMTKIADIMRNDNDNKENNGNAK